MVRRWTASLLRQLSGLLQRAHDRLLGAPSDQTTGEVDDGPFVSRAPGKGEPPILWIELARRHAPEMLERYEQERETPAEPSPPLDIRVSVYEASRAGPQPKAGKSDSGSTREAPASSKPSSRPATAEPTRPISAARRAHRPDPRSPVETTGVPRQVSEEGRSIEEKPARSTFPKAEAGGRSMPLRAQILRAFESQERPNFRIERQARPDTASPLRPDRMPRSPAGARAEFTRVIPRAAVTGWTERQQSPRAVETFPPNTPQLALPIDAKKPFPVRPIRRGLDAGAHPPVVSEVDPPISASPYLDHTARPASTLDARRDDVPPSRATPEAATWPLLPDEAATEARERWVELPDDVWSELAPAAREGNERERDRSEGARWSA